ncbi:enoyl-CoA hydratase-related protein [Kitasatospora sp. NPDC053057]|uniref:enoyl-CoA hydratase-related protein n=1 Tax=Kitasatospora sp. NPDC053057 TaxID=3364062 RepID=UPI0037CAD14C
MGVPGVCPGRNASRPEGRYPGRSIQDNDWIVLDRLSWPRSGRDQGAGPRAFSAGADIPSLAGSIAGGQERALREFVRRGHALTRRIEEFPKPVIVAVHGLAYGGGCEITEAAPLAIAAEHATFAEPEISLGFPPPFGGEQRLPRHMGRKRGLELILTSDPVVPASELLDEVRDLADRIIRYAPTAVAACLRAATRGDQPADRRGSRGRGGRLRRHRTDGRCTGRDPAVPRPRPGPLTSA